jgi:hypothetical protein
MRLPPATPDHLDPLTDQIADDIALLAREHAAGKLPCSLGDASVELAVEIAGTVMRALTIPLN